MPELPEVETMVRGLRPALLGQRLERVRVLDPKMLVGTGASRFESRARGAVVNTVTRRGKWVAIGLNEPGNWIVIEPRMTGGFWLVLPQRLDHARLIFDVEGRRDPIWFCDTRRLGRIRWFATTADAEAAFDRSHGPDALTIGQAELAERLVRTTRAIKPALMDQKRVAGIGNIYADEILFQARIHPERPAHRLKPADFARLHRAMGQVLHAAIAAEGSSFDAGYRTVLGREGGFLAQNAMYGRENQPCPACGAPVRKTRIAGLVGRPTYYCAHCQRRSGRGSTGPKPMKPVR